MNDDRDTGFTLENVFKALMTVKEATEMGFARVEADLAALGAGLRSELRSEIDGLEHRLGTKIDNLERGIIRVDDRLAALEESA